MTNKTVHKIMLGLTTLLMAFVPLVASAQFGTGNNCSGGISVNSGVSGGLDTLNNCSEVETLNIPNTREGVVVLIGRFINWALYLAGAVAVVFIIIGGYRYIVSAGSSDGAGAGKKTLINALIGLVIIILAYVIVNVVVNFISS
jgi:hypothetical protein